MSLINFNAKQSTYTQKTGTKKTGQTSNAQKTNKTTQSNQTNQTNQTSQTNKMDQSIFKQNNGGHMSVSEGYAAISSSKSTNANMQAQTNQANQSQQTASKYSQDAIKLNKTMQQDNKNFQKTIQEDNKSFAKDQKSISNLMQQTNANNNEINQFQSQVNDLLGGDNTGVGKSSAFSLSLAGDDTNSKGTKGTSNNNSSSSGTTSDKAGQDTAAKLTQLQSQIDQKVELGKGYGNQIKTLTLATKRTVHKMQTSSQAHVKKETANQKSLQTNLNKTNSIIKFGTKVQEIGTTVKNTGDTLQKGGELMIIAGEAATGTIIGSGAGAALIAAGKAVKTAGTVTSKVGTIGIAAGAATISVGQAAAGNLAGAISSATTAIQSGAAAIKSLKGLNTEMKGTDKLAKETTKLSDKINSEVEKTKEKVQEKIKEFQNPGNIAKAAAGAIIDNGIAQTGLNNYATPPFAGNQDQSLGNVASDMLKKHIPFGQNKNA